MRHRKSGRKLGRTPAHRRATLRNLVTNLFLTAQDEKPWRITTTVPKAKEARPLAERCITLAKRARAQAPDGEPRSWDSPPVRRLRGLLQDRLAVEILLETVAPLYNDRNGGYTRILRLDSRRLGDGTDLCYLELVTEPVEEKQAATRPAEPVAPKRVSGQEAQEKEAPAGEASTGEEAARAQDAPAEGAEPKETDA